MPISTLIIIFVIGLVIGWLARTFLSYFTVAGTLHINTSDPHKDVYLLEFDKDLDDIPKKKHLMLKIDTTRHKSH